MGTPTGHALLSASSAHRWLECTASPRFEQQFPGGTSEYAEEGTLAHAICEVLARAVFKQLPNEQFQSSMAIFKANPLFKPEMLTTANIYIDCIADKAKSFENPPYIALEVRVDLSDVIPEGFGTCDCSMIGGDTLHIMDYKHGIGVQVDALENPQMRLYALGALKKYAPVFGKSIKKVSMSICQPRISETPSEDVMTVEELLAWGESIKPIAQKAFDGSGEFKPGEHCRFCRGKAVCKARSAPYLAMQDFQGLELPNKATPPIEAVEREAADLSPIMSYDEIANALRVGRGLVDWYEDLKECAKQALLNGEVVPGFKVVAGKSDRAFSIPAEKVVEILKSQGVSDEVIFKPQEQKTLSQLEKVLGKKVFSNLLSDYVVKPIGKPALAEESDKRPVYSPAAKDFEGINDK